MERRYMFYYECYDGTKGSEELELTLDDLELMCFKYDNDCDLVWWDYEFVG